MKTFLRVVALIMLSSASVFAHQVTLSCTPSTSVVVGYNVYRELTGTATFTKLTAAPVVACGYVDTAVSAGVSYTYAMTAVNASGEESVMSAPAIAVVPVTAPTGVKATAAKLAKDSNKQ